MSFKINYKQLLKKYKEIWKEVKSLLNIKFDSEPVYGDNDKYIKTKIKIYDGRVEKVHQTSLVVNLIMIKQNLMMRKFMMNLTNNLLKAKKILE